MRKYLLLLFCLAAFIIKVQSASIRVDVDNLRYTVDTDTQTAELYGPVSSSTVFNNLVIPDNIEYRGSQIPVISIRNNAFSSNKNLRGSLTIGNNVQTIGDRAFYYCSGFTGSLTIGNSVETIGDFAFEYCSGFTGSLTIGNSVETIGDHAFYNCSGFTGSLTIGRSVETIGNFAFNNCSGFTGSLTIPDNVQSIGESAFRNCSGFTGSLTIPDNVQSIGESAFSNCSGFTGSLTIGDNVETIGDRAFLYCSGFTGSLTIPDNVQTIGKEAFYKCSGFTGSLTIGRSVETIGDYAFYNCSGFTGSLTIGNSVETIGDYAFEYCSGFTGSLTIGNNVQTIGDSAFEYCKGFAGSLTIGNNVQTIGDYAFSDCENFMGELIIPESVKEIGHGCFAGCKNLTSLVITSSNTVINYQSFQCYGLESITCLGLIPPKCVYGGQSISGGIIDYVFSTSTYNKPLYVPAESVNLYKNATEWKKFTIINPIPVEATDITLNKTELTLLVGQEETLIATLTPQDATTEVVWSVVDENPIISINQAGKVTARAVGVATVKATAGEVSATCKVTVNPILATSILIDGDDIHTLKETETLQLTATVLPQNTTYQEITWSSSDESKATISTSGLVTAIEEGNVEIIATLSYQSEITASYPITIQKRLLGDANDNGVVNVADVGTISDYIVKKPVYNFCFVNADVITDGKITTADVTATVDIIFNDTPSIAKFAKARKISGVGNNELIVDNFNSPASSIVGINLKNPSEFTGLQGTILIPEGVTIKNVTKAAGASNHILNYNVTDYGKIEFILYSLQNASFEEIGSLIELEIQAQMDCDDIIVENILASDSDANEYSLPFTGGKNNDLITSLESVDNANIRIYSSSQGVVILNAQGENVNVFNIAGERIVSAEALSNKEIYPLTSGVYIVTVKSETAKLIVK